MLSFRKLARRAKAAVSPCPGGAFSDDTYTRLQSFDELFEGEAVQDLQHCRELLESAGFDVSLAAELEKAQLQEVLEGQPLSHVMRVWRLLQNARRARTPPPGFSHLWWGRYMSRAELRGDAHDSHLLFFELTTVMSSLFFTVAASSAMSPATSCKFDGNVANATANSTNPSPMCEQLLWADVVFWALTAAICLMSSIMCWFSILHIQCLSHDEIVPFMSGRESNNRACMWVGVSVAVVGVVFLFLGLCTRSIIVARSKLQGFVLTTIVAGTGIIVLVWWGISTQLFQGDRRAQGVLQFIRFQFGAFGFGKQA
eukprot:g1174.t1